jgi:uncharacterized protein (DUF58 family)
MNLPDLAELIALRGLARSLSLHTHRPALAQLQGGHRSAQRGRGLEFEEVRLYAAGDDARNIDWRVTARRGKMHTKLFREERERPVWLVTDLHAGLFFGSKRQLKSALLVRAAAMLAWVAVQGGDRVGAIITNERSAPRIFQPRSREAGVLPILEYLIEMQPQAPGVPQHSGLFTALSAVRPLLQPGCQVMLLSDFGGLDRAVEDLLTDIAVRSDCRLMWITDPLECNGLPDGPHYLGVPGNVWHMDGAQTRSAWIKVWQRREQQLSNLAIRHKFPLSRLTTSDLVQEQLTTLLREPRWAA